MLFRRRGGRPPHSAYTPEAIARGLVVSLMPEIERRMVEGGPYLTIMREVVEAARPGMVEAHGAEAAARVRAILEGLGAVAVLTSYGRAEFIGRGFIVTPPAPRLSPSGGWGTIWATLAPR